MNQTQQTVIDLFKRKQTGYDDNIGKITHLWQTFCERNIDEIQEPATYAAGLEYLAGQTLLGPKRSQRVAAEIYGTTINKVSRTYKMIYNTVSDLSHSYWKAVVDGKTEPKPSSSISTVKLVNEIIGMPIFPGRYEKNLTSDEMFRIGDLFSYYQDTSYLKTLWELFELHPYHPDLYIIVAEFASHDHNKKKILTKAVMNGENAIDDFIMKELHGELWMEIDARPYLRAKAAYAAQLEREYDFDGAILQYRELMRLNEGDNQGIRFKLLPLYLQQGYLQEARALLDSFQESETFMIFYEVIYSYYDEGLSEETLRMLREADAFNPHFRELWLHPKRREERLNGLIQEREETEAAIAVEDTLWAWEWNKELSHALKNLR